MHLFYKLIYSLKQVKLENKFIKFSKSFIRAPILFIKKFDKLFYICINYQSLNNLVIKKSILIMLD